jgi:hypothetical protein
MVIVHGYVKVPDNIHTITSISPDTSKYAHDTQPQPYMVWSIVYIL